MASVVSMRAAMEEAFCRAERVTGLNMDDSLGFMGRSIPGVCAELKQE